MFLWSIVYMNEYLWQTYHRLIEESHVEKQRFLYAQFDTNSRLSGLIGPRGVGKTTMLLQFIKQHLYQSEKVFYFSADNTYFNETSVLEFTNELYQTYGIRYLFIDEIHEYPNWNQELKNIYDSFPNLKVFFSGSSSIDLTTGSYDLSRRAQLHYLPGLSLREYLNISLGLNIAPVSFDELLENHQEIANGLSKIQGLRLHLLSYIESGYYPVVFEARERLTEILDSIIEKTIYEDVAKFYKLKTPNLIHFRRIINFLATIPPGEIKTSNLAHHLQIDHKTADNYIDILKRASLIKVVMPSAHGNQILTKPSKIFLDNTTLLRSINVLLDRTVDLGTQRELFVLQHLTGANQKVFIPKVGDFKVDQVHIEIGGKNKTAKQLQTVSGKRIIVKDDIFLGYGNTIPLYLFGLLY